jgi:hypothetical protein
MQVERLLVAPNRFGVTPEMYAPEGPDGLGGKIVWALCAQ